LGFWLLRLAEQKVGGASLLMGKPGRRRRRRSSAALRPDMALPVSW
jgi:hypothetical protein